MAITVTFDPPLPSDSPSVFNTKAFTLLGDLNDWSTEANSLASTVSSNASTSTTNASNASTSADAAATSASNAAASYDSFDDRYLGSKSSAPTLDNDGAALLTGALYWDSVLSAMFVRTSGGAWTALNASTGIAQAITVNSSSAALTVTQTGSGNAFVVEDSASTDSTPFVIDGAGKVLVGTTSSVTLSEGDVPFLQSNGTDSRWGLGLTRFSANAQGTGIYLGKSRGATVGTNAVVLSGDELGRITFCGDDSTDLYTIAALIRAEVDGTPGTNDMPGRLVFSTTADGASSPTERMRIDNAGNVGIGGAATNQQKLRLAGTYPGSAGYSFPVIADGIIDPAVAATACYVFQTNVTISAGALPDLRHFTVNPGAYTGTVTTQYGFIVPSTLTGATNNYGFYSNIAAAANRYNFYAAGTAPNYFGGNVTVGGGGTLGYGAGSGGTVTQATSKATAVTLNKPSGQITMHNAALASGASVTFTVNCTAVISADTINLTGVYATVDPSNYRIEKAYVATTNAFAVRVTNISAGSLSEALVIQFCVVKGSTS